MQIDYTNNPKMKWLTPELQEAFGKLHEITMENERKLIMEKIQGLRRGKCCDMRFIPLSQCA